jgi:hypothetical protein
VKVEGRGSRLRFKVPGKSVLGYWFVVIVDWFEVVVVENVPETKNQD